MARPELVVSWPPLRTLALGCDSNGPGSEGSLAAKAALGVACEELRTGLAVEAGRHGAERLVELVEGSVHRVDGEVAGEHAPVDDEGLDGVLEPRGEGIDAHGLQRHRQTRELARHVVAEAG